MQPEYNNQPENLNTNIATATTNTPQKKPRNKSAIALVLVTIVSLVTIGLLGYSLINENSNSQKVELELQEKQNYINNNEQALLDASMEPAYRPLLQKTASSECETNSAVLFKTTVTKEKNSDGSIKKYYVVGQYVCNYGTDIVAIPARFVAAQSYDGNNWEFTYGSSTLDPATLPKYIFDTDPELYNNRFNTPDTF